MLTPADCREPGWQWASRSISMGVPGLGGGVGRPERTRLRGDFAVLQGKNRETQKIEPETAHCAPYNSLILPVFLLEFPTQEIREFSGWSREVSYENRVLTERNKEAGRATRRFRSGARNHRELTLVVPVQVEYLPPVHNLDSIEPRRGSRGATATSEHNQGKFSRK